MPTVTTTQIEEVRIEPKLKKKLQARLEAYAAQKAKLTPIYEEMDRLKAELDDIRQDLGVMSLDVEGSKITMVAGIYRKLDKKKFVALGGDLKILQLATIEKPKKPYTKITLKGEKDESYDDE
jgi:hypothetical protein